MTLPKPLFSQAGSGYTDLLLALHSGQPEALATMAGLLGFAQLPPEEVIEPENLPPDEEEPPPPSPISAPPESTGYPANIQDILFWVPVHFQAREKLEVVTTPEEKVTCELPFRNPAISWLTPWSRLLPKMRQRFSEQVPGREADMDKIVQRILQGQPLDPVPLRRRRRWGRGVQLILDRAEHLIPVQADLDHSARCLAKLFGHQAVEYSLLLDPQRGPLIRTAEGGFRAYRLPEPGTLVVVLGDLGQLAPQATAMQPFWQRLGEALRRRGCRAVALTPAPYARCQPERLPAWNMLPLAGEKRQAPPEENVLAAQAERLLRLLSPAIRIEPGLLRAVRLLLGAHADAGTEMDVWNHPLMVGRSRVAGVLDPEALPRLRADFARLEPSSLQQKVVETIRAWRGEVSQEVWFEELLHLSDQQLPEPIRQQDLPAAYQFFKNLPAGPLPVSRPKMLQWFRRIARRMGKEFLHPSDPELEVALQRLYLEACADNLTQTFLQGIDLRLLPAEHAQPMDLFLAEQAGALQVAREKKLGSSLGMLRSRQNRLLLGERLEEIEELPDNTPEFWRSGRPPSWADRWGQDAFGPWVEFVVNKVRQRMRWIPPGRFMMGSPEDEYGREAREDPQHEVVFSNGFWLWDTACTQELWQAVMEKNPSRFQGSRLPVERVVFDDVQQFFRRMENLLPDLSLTLPSEAQWEYACRAGSRTPFSFGDTITTEQANFDGRSPYLRQEPKGIFRQQTVPVTTLPANAWGLFEMHGNVWEWCQDTWHDSYTGAPGDGSARESGKADAPRLLRGGSWFSSARYVRAACRDGRGPSVRYGFIGFRCARVHVGQAGKQTFAEPLPRPPRNRASVVPLELAKGSVQGSASLPHGKRLQIQSDSETLTLFRQCKPDWAAAVGRDSFGLWADWQLGQVRQRMRWIPPGRFMMGSPKDEPGRFDHEGPQHEVILSSGFWMFDTPCTQALWQAVMGENPSFFQSAERPVEQVSFNEVQAFLEKIEKKVPGIALSLPSEAQWEYACRAGSRTALYSGEITILGKHDAPALDSIAWYGGNSGQGFDLDNGWNTSKWREKQYPEKMAGTRLVRKKSPNLWGLYDMLGNVWEWCQDNWHDSYAGAPSDGHAWEKKSVAPRLLRGGSWVGDARYVRAASRDGVEPSHRSGFIGFRCVRVHW